MIGNVVGYMTAINEISATKVLCRCECGTEKIVYKKQFQRGAYQSCGCKRDQINSDKQKVHGMRRSVEYLAWCNMRRRCKPSYKHAKDYFERGIVVCDRWISSFENFLTDMGKRPSPNHSLDRKNNDGIYEPSNCRWAIQSQQSFNQRQDSNKASGVKGVTWANNVNKWRVRINVKKIPLTDKYFSEIEDAILFRKYFVENFSDLYGDNVTQERRNECVFQLNAFYEELAQKMDAA